MLPASHAVEDEAWLAGEGGSKAALAARSVSEDVREFDPATGLDACMLRRPPAIADGHAAPGAAPLASPAPPPPPADNFKVRQGGERGQTQRRLVRAV